MYSVNYKLSSHVRGLFTDTCTCPSDTGLCLCICAFMMHYNQNTFVKLSKEMWKLDSETKQVSYCVCFTNMYNMY